MSGHSPYIYIYIYIIMCISHRYKESGPEQLMYAMHVKDRYVNCTFIDKLTKWYQ